MLLLESLTRPPSELMTIFANTKAYVSGINVGCQARNKLLVGKLPYRQMASKIIRIYRRHLTSCLQTRFSPLISLTTQHFVSHKRKQLIRSDSLQCKRRLYSAIPKLMPGIKLLVPDFLGRDQGNQQQTTLQHNSPTSSDSRNQNEADTRVSAFADDKQQDRRPRKQFINQ